MIEPLFEAMSALLHDKPVEDVIPILITASARALVLDADGDINLLSTLLLKFCRLVQNEAANMLESDQGTTRQ